MLALNLSTGAHPGPSQASQKGPLSDPKKLLDDLFEFDKVPACRCGSQGRNGACISQDNIAEPVIKKIGEYVDREAFCRA